MCTVYDEHKDDDGFLYFTYTGEKTFGQNIDAYFQPWDTHDLSPFEYNPKWGIKGFF